MSKRRKLNPPFEETVEEKMGERKAIAQLLQRLYDLKKVLFRGTSGSEEIAGDSIEPYYQFAPAGEEKEEREEKWELPRRHAPTGEEKEEREEKRELPRRHAPTAGGLGSGTINVHLDFRTDVAFTGFAGPSYLNMDRIESHKRRGILEGLNSLAARRLQVSWLNSRNWLKLHEHVSALPANFTDIPTYVWKRGKLEHDIALLEAVVNTEQYEDGLMHLEDGRILTRDEIIDGPRAPQQTSYSNPPYPNDNPTLLEKAKTLASTDVLNMHGFIVGPRPNPVIFQMLIAARATDIRRQLRHWERQLTKGYDTDDVLEVADDDVIAELGTIPSTLNFDNLQFRKLVSNIGSRRALLFQEARIAAFRESLMGRYRPPAIIANVQLISYRNPLLRPDGTIYRSPEESSTHSIPLQIPSIVRADSYTNYYPSINFWPSFKERENAWLRALEQAKNNDQIRIPVAFRLQMVQDNTETIAAIETATSKMKALIKQLRELYDKSPEQREQLRRLLNGMYTIAKPDTWPALIELMQELLHKSPEQREQLQRILNDTDPVTWPHIIGDHREEMRLLGNQIPLLITARQITEKKLKDLSRGPTFDFWQADDTLRSLCDERDIPDIPLDIVNLMCEFVPPSEQTPCKQLNELRMPHHPLPYRCVHCDGRDDLITREAIPAGAGVCVGGQCYDGRRVEHLDTALRNDARLPHSRQHMTPQAYETYLARRDLHRGLLLTPDTAGFCDDGPESPFGKREA